jgi:predicted esterase
MRRLAATLAAALIAAMMTQSPAQTVATTPGIHPCQIVASWDGSLQPYNLFIPSAPTDELMPLVVVLHGKGATWESWFAATDVTRWAEREGFVVIAPHGRGDWFYLGPGESDTLDTIRAVSAALPIDPDRVYLLGHSMGGWGTWHLGAAHPNLFAAIVPMATWPPVQLLPSTRYLAPYILHGSIDDIVSVQGSRLARAHLANLGIEHNYEEFPDRAHESALISESLARIGDWIRDRRRVTGAATVQLRAYTPRRGDNQWLRLHAVEIWTRLACIDAQRELNTLHITTSNVRAFAVDLAGAGGSLHLDTLNVDGSLLRLRFHEPGDWAIIERSGAGWTARIAGGPVAATPQPRVLFELVKPPTKLPLTIAGQIAKRFDVDIAAVPSDLVAPQLWPGPFTEDHLIDIFLHEEDSIVIYTMTPTEWQDLLARQAEWYPRWWREMAIVGAPAADAKTIRLAVPRVLADRMPAQGRDSGVRLRRVVYEAIMAGDQLQDR